MKDEERKCRKCFLSGVTINYMLKGLLGRGGIRKHWVQDLSELHILTCVIRKPGLVQGNQNSYLY